MLYCAHHGAGHADYTFTEYPELENALLEKLDVDHNGKLDSTDVFLIITCIMVYGFKIKIKMFRFFQDSYIYAEPDYGICIFNVILYNILRCRTY